MHQSNMQQYATNGIKLVFASDCFLDKTIWSIKDVSVSLPTNLPVTRAHVRNAVILDKVNQDDLISDGARTTNKIPL